MRNPLLTPLAATVTACLLAACGGDLGSDGSVAVLVTDAHGASLGSVALPVSCDGEAAPYLNRGVALLHNMTYSEAEASFSSAWDADPACVLAKWGMAMSYVHPLWPDVPSGERLTRGLELLSEARELRVLTEREEAYISALEAYYRDGSSRTESARLASYAEGWRTAHEQDSTDLEAKLFRSLTAIAVAAVADDRTHALEGAGKLAEEVLERVPDHTGALHYIIHAYDHPALAERALSAAGTYGQVAPENSHALHMTSHIFTRVGYWEESIEYNARAAQAALSSPINDQVSFHYLHAADYLAYAHLQRLDLEAAGQVLTDMMALEGDVFDHAASVYAFAAVPARLALERQDWEAASLLETRVPASLSWDNYPHLVAITEFARSLGSARTGRTEAALAATRNLANLRTAAAALPGQYDWGTQVQIQEIAARAWIEFEAGRIAEALELMTQAADLEATTQKNPVTPGEVLPAAELLGDMLMDLGQHEAAQVAYSRALERSPNRLNSLYGAGRSAELSGNLEGARVYYETIIANAVSGAASPKLDHARSMVEAAGQG